MTESQCTLKLSPIIIGDKFEDIVYLFKAHPTFTVIVGSYQLRRYASKKEETDEEFDARWEAYFNRDEIDAWELRKGLNDLYGYDVVPQPKIVVAMLKAARRLNDVALAVRILEAVKEKAAGDQNVYSFVMEGMKPTLEELGLETPEKLGIA